MLSRKSADCAASTWVELSRHDRLNLEIKAHHRCPDPSVRTCESVVDVWWFIPNAVGVNPASYHASDFYSDLRAHTRLMTPPVSLDVLARRDGPGSPLASLETQLARAPSGGSSTRMQRDVRHEARMLVCIFRRAARDAAAAVEAAPESAGAMTFASSCRRLLSNYRSVRRRLEEWGVGDATAFALAACDEALSVETEAVVTRLLDVARGDLGGARGPLATLAREERALREARGDRSGARPDAKDGDEQARFWDQASLLKKFVSQALFLTPRQNNDARRLEHVAKAVAAALAMIWTLMLQIASVLLLGLELNSRVDLRAIILFSAVAILGYILKDRIKDTVGRRLASAIPRLLYDRRLDLFRPDADEALGQVRERVRFVEASAMPADVRARRNAGARAPLATRVPFDALHYQRRVMAYPRDAARAFARMSGLTDILRVNLLSWIRTLDARHKSVMILDEGGGAVEAQVPNRYFVDVVVRIEDAEGIRLEMWRLELTRRGLQRVVRVGPAAERAEVRVAR
jgi:hypothetical protein